MNKSIPLTTNKRQTASVKPSKPIILIVHKKRLLLIIENNRNYLRRQMHRFITILMLTLTANTVFAYPITPQTLRKLIERSQFIVIATIDNPEKVKKYYNETTKDSMEYFIFGGDGLADLYITEILKGKLENQQAIQVGYEAGMICPAPANYPDKKMVIAFLGKEDTSNVYYTVGLSYGSKIMDSEAELNTFKQRITEYIEILKITNKKNRKIATVEWLVKCAEDKNTRWDGAYEFGRKGDFMSYYDRSKDEQFYKKLTKSQMHRLDSTFFATDTIGYNELCLVNLVSTNNYPKLINHLVKSMPNSEYYITTDIMKKIIELIPNNELQQIFNETYNLSYNDKEKESKQKILIEKFVRIASKQ
jgi:hypothetical protein